MDKQYAFIPPYDVNETYTGRFWRRLAPYIVRYEQLAGSHDVTVYVEGPAHLIRQWGRFNTFEVLDDSILETCVIQARATYREDAGVFRMYITPNVDAE